MSPVHIQVSVDELCSFEAQIQTFRYSIADACTQLQQSADRLAPFLDEQSYQAVYAGTEQISQILQDNMEQLDTLQGCVSTYCAYVLRLRALLGADTSSSTALPQSVQDSFDRHDYRTLTLQKPMTVYRYFGSSKTPPKKHCTKKMRVKSRSAPLDENGHSPGWGSSAGGVFTTTCGTLSSRQAIRYLALNKDWGNSALYRATIVIPAGTQVSIGGAKQVTSADGTVYPGGARQVVIHQPWSAKMNAWIQNCAPVKLT